MEDREWTLIPVSAPRGVRLKKSSSPKRRRALDMWDLWLDEAGVTRKLMIVSSVYSPQGIAPFRDVFCATRTSETRRSVPSVYYEHPTQI